MKWILANLMVLALAADGAWAQDGKQLELHVSGDLTIGAEGQVHSLRLQDGLAPEFRERLEQRIERWRFEPILENGKPVLAEARMSLKLVAAEFDAGYRLMIDQVSFGESLAFASMKAPRYPPKALEARTSGKVELKARIAADGTVLEAHPYRVGLLSYRNLTDARRKRMKNLFERSAIAAVKDWRLEPSPSGEPLTVLIPITYVITRSATETPPVTVFEMDPPRPTPLDDSTDIDSALLEGMDTGLALVPSARIRLHDEVSGRTL